MSTGKIKQLAFSEGAVVTAPTDGFTQSRSIGTYVNDAAFVTAKGSAAAAGDLYFSTSLNAIREYDGTNWRTVVTRDGTETLSGKTLLTPVIDDYAEINEETAPGTPAAGTVRLYAKTGGKLYLKDSTGTEYTIADTASSLTNPMSAVGDLIYGGTAGAATRLAGSTTAARRFLGQLGNGSASAAPTWEALIQSDIPLADNANKGGISRYIGPTSITPTLSPSGGSFGSVTYVTQRGMYTRIGDVIHFMIYIEWSAATTGTASGSLRVSGLPLASINDSNHYAPVTVLQQRIDLTLTSPVMVGRVTPNSAVIELYDTGDNQVPSALAVSTATAGGFNKYITLAGFYFV